MSQFPAQPIYRILDANLDRAREGIRIIEEWCRFGLNNAPLTDDCKQLRQDLAKLHTDEIHQARDTSTDPGTTLSHPQEEQRQSLAQLLRVNFCRVQEALRVLEEYGKLYSPSMGNLCKQMRYRVYILESKVLESKVLESNLLEPGLMESQLMEPGLMESQLTGSQRYEKLLRSPLYLVTTPVPHLLSVVEAALKGGLSLVQYRDKTADDTMRLQTAKDLCTLCHQYNALFIINDRVDLALAVDADGVHLGQQDLPIAIARQLLGAEKIIGRSTTNPDEMERSIREGADYIGVGPVYETPTKAGKPAAGLEYVQYAKANATVPWYAIGGIDTENILDVLGAGSDRVAVVRAIMSAANPALVTRSLLAQLQQ